MTKIMSKCHNCGKPVYFAERKSSLGYDWHPECLRCGECGKVLRPGQHAEHRGIPYCHIPCYSALFGPRLVGHGSPVGAHTSFGNPESRPTLSISRDALLAKLKVFNQYFTNKSGQLDSRELNGRVILEGSLKIYWGMSKPIRLIENDGIPVPQKRHSYLLNDEDENDDGDEEEEQMDMDSYHSQDKSISTADSRDLSTSSDNHSDKSPGVNIDINSYEVRYRKRSHRVKLQRRCSINGHFYNKETSVFTPAYGSMTTVRITSLVNTPEVIRLLLRKFKVINSPEEFGLFIVRDSGECRQIKDVECPLLVRVMLGPFEDVAKIFIMDKESSPEVSSEVAQYILFSTVELQKILQKFYEEEEREVEKIQRKFYQNKKALQWRLLEIQPAEQI